MSAAKVIGVVILGALIGHLYIPIGLLVREGPVRRYPRPAAVHRERRDRQRSPGPRQRDEVRGPERDLDRLA